MAVLTEPAQDRQPKARIFISYSRKDMAFADRLEAGLRARGFEPLIDRTEIYALEDWWQRIQALIGKADTIVFVLSPDAVASDICMRKEVAFATSLSKRFAPIVCRGVRDDTVPEALRRLNYIFFDDPIRFETSADVLAEALQTDIRWIRQHTEFGEQTRRWAAAGLSRGPRGSPLRSPMLEEAERWIASRPPGRAARRPRKPRHSWPRAGAPRPGETTFSRRALRPAYLSRSGLAGLAFLAARYCRRAGEGVARKPAYCNARRTGGSSNGAAAIWTQP